MLARYLSEIDRRVTAIDLASRPNGWPARWDWLSGDLFSIELPEVDGVLANLFLHHFRDEVLRMLGDRLRSTGATDFIFSEPARRPLHHWQGRVAHPLINRVTRHDMHVSIDAGFDGDELASLLGFATEAWSSTVEQTFLGAYRLSVSRRS